jgi:hypothetical protein
MEPDPQIISIFCKLNSKMLKKPASGVLARKHPHRSPSGKSCSAAWGWVGEKDTPPVISSAAALLDGLFEHLAGELSCCITHDDIEVLYVGK